MAVQSSRSLHAPVPDTAGANADRQRPSPAFNPVDLPVLAKHLEWIEEVDESNRQHDQEWKVLQSLFEYQLQVGCGQPSCNQPTCMTYQMRTQARPVRHLTQVSTSALAMMLAEGQDAIERLCESTADLLGRTYKRRSFPDQPLDRTSFLQHMFATETIKVGLSSTNLGYRQHRNGTRVPILSTLTGDSIQFLAEILLHPGRSPFAYEVEARAFLHKSCKRIFSDPVKLNQFYGPILSQMDSMPHLTPKIASSLKQLVLIFKHEPLSWITHAAERFRHLHRTRLRDSEGAFADGSDLPITDIRLFKLACHMLVIYTNNTPLARTLTDGHGKIDLGLAQVHHSHAIRLAQTIADELAPMSIQNAAPDPRWRHSVSHHESIQDRLLHMLSHSFQNSRDQELSPTDTSPTALPDLLSPLMLWLRIFCLVETHGCSTVQRDSQVDRALSAFQLLFKMLPPAEQLDLPLFDLKTKSSISVMQPLGEMCDPDKLVEEWINPRPGRRALLEYPFLFWGSDKAPQTQNLILGFRRICFMRMLKVHMAACMNIMLINPSNSSGSIRSHFEAPLAAEVTNINERIESLLNEMPPHGLKPALMTQLEIKISRESLLDDALDHVWQREKRHLLAPIKVKFCDAGEIAADLGGVAQEFFRLVAVHMQNPQYGLFTLNGPRRMAWFNASCCEPTYKYSLLGILTGLAVHNGFTLPVSFPLLLYRRLLDPSRPIETLEEIEDCWPELVAGFKGLLSYKGNVEEDIAVDHTFPVSHPGGVSSLPMNDEARAALASRQSWERLSELAATSAAAAVDNSNRHDYVKDYVDFLTTSSVKPQFEAFAHGLYSVLDPSILATLTPTALRVLVEGHQDINPDDLASATQYNQFSRNDPVIRFFWTYVRSLDAERLKKLLEFVTATDRVPVNGLASLGFTIQRHGDGDDGRLPSASTCFGVLLLPAYRTQEALAEKMEQALDNAEGFGLR